MPPLSEFYSIYLLRRLLFNQRFNFQTLLRLHKRSSLLSLAQNIAQETN